MFIKLKSNVDHNGEKYTAGQSVEMDDKSAQLLIDSNVAEAVEQPKAEKPKSEEKKSLDKMNKKELLAEAEAKDVEVSEDMTNAEIVAKIKGE